MSLPTYVIPGLESGFQWATDKVSLNLNYTFWTSTPSYDTIPAENSDFMAFTPTMQTAAVDALNLISSYANVTFTEVAQTPEANTQIGYGLAGIPRQDEAYTHPPDAASGLYAGDIWGNRTYFTEYPDGTPDPTGLHVVAGSYDFMTILHETGHALGLKHPFEAPAIPSEEDSTQYSLMSYTLSPYYYDANSKTYLNPETYMPYDIAALQDLYGVNTTYNTGNDDYVLNPDHIYTIWDAGGTDTLDGSAVTTNMVLDLQQGHYSSVAVSTTISHNIAIAYGTVIENAIGGSGNDTIFDNSSDNSISGGAGNDLIYLTTGNDTVDGGTGNDVIHLGAGNDMIDGGANTDTVVFNGNYADFSFSNFAGASVDVLGPGGAADTIANVENYQFNDITFASYAALQAGLPNLVLTGTAANETLTGGAGNDTLSGLAGNDVLNGGSGNDTLDGGAGADKMYGGLGNDVYIVDSAKDITDEVLGLSGGIDTVESSVTRTLGAGLENLILEGSLNLKGTGNTLDNVLTGNSGANALNGGAGNDTLDGGAGHDILTGGTGADTFLFHAATAYGAPDTITDFKLSQGDKIDISDLLTAYNPGTDVLSDFVHITMSGRTAVLSVDADGTGGASTFQTIATLSGAGTLPDLNTLVNIDHALIV